VVVVVVAAAEVVVVVVVVAAAEGETATDRAVGGVEAVAALGDNDNALPLLLPPKVAFK
jgi:hypothetical protein